MQYHTLLYVLGVITGYLIHWYASRGLKKSIDKQTQKSIDGFIIPMKEMQHEITGSLQSKKILTKIYENLSISGKLDRRTRRELFDYFNKKE